MNNSTYGLRVIGIDPGSIITGYGIVETTNDRIRLIDSGVIKTNPKFPLSDRLLTIKNGLDNLLREFSPHEAAVESVFTSFNARSSLILGHARGAILVTIASAGVIIREFSPKEIKVAGVGYGNADKQQVQRMVGLILGTNKVFKEDEADAIAAGICLINSRSNFNPAANI